MTGLDLDNDVIIEIFCIITDGSLNAIDEEGWGTVVHQPKEKMDAMVVISPLHVSRLTNPL
jgi:oligoribonuclease